MSLVDEGKLSLDDSVGKYLPLFSKYGKGAIKIRHCLSHTTGLESGSMSIFGLIEEYKKRERMGSLEEEVNDFARNRKLLARPGTEFRYSSIGLNIAGRIAEIVSGKDFEEIFQERIAIPLGLKHTHFTNGKGPVNPSGSASSTAVDYMTFLAMILQKGAYQGIRILSEQSVSEMQKPQIRLSMVKYAPRPAAGFTYGLGEWVEESAKDGTSTAVASPGLFGSWPLVDNCHRYACLFFIKSLLNEKQKDIYLEIKKNIDSQFNNACQ
jgi:CubicO group peptidase (beta-lactamase class C family)